MSAEVYAEDGYFAVIPEWVLYADITAQAVRLYAVLRRYADQRTLAAHPTRKALAEKLKVKDLKVVDRSVAELVAIGAVRTFARYSEEGDRAANGYVLLARPVDQPVEEAPPAAPQPTARPARDARPAPNGVEAQEPLPPGSATPTGRRSDPHGGGFSTPTVGVEKGALQREPLEPEPLNQRSTPPTPSADAARRPRGRGGRTIAAIRSGETPAFVEFWAAYPRHKHRLKAAQVWAALGCEEIAADVIAGAARYRDDPNRVERYTSHPTTWLNAGGWDDDPEPVRHGESKTEAEDEYRRRRSEAARQAAADADARDRKQRPLELVGPGQHLQAAALPWGGDSWSA